MGLIYIKFKTDVLTTSEQKLKSWSASTTDDFATKILNRLTPNVNPDFDDQVENVKEWILEVDDEDGMPMREVGPPPLLVFQIANTNLYYSGIYKSNLGHQQTGPLSLLQTPLIHYSEK